MEELLQKARTQLTFIILGLGIFFTVISLLMCGLQPTTLTVWMIAFLQNLAAGFIGAFVVLWIVEKNLSTLQSLAQKQQEKDSLIFKMSNPNDTAAALEALRLLRQNNHVTDGSLRGKKLDWAMLQSSNLQEADLREANLGGADLENASLWYANLQGAILGSANLKNANLAGAKLQGADLHGAKLTGAIIDDHTIFDEQTTMPDGSKWSSETDLKTFTLAFTWLIAK